MLDPTKPANLCLSLATTLVLALCVALTMIASCGSPPSGTPPILSPSSPYDSPTDVRPMPTAVGSTPTHAARSTVPPQEEAALVGIWADDWGLTLDLGDSGVYTQSYGYRQPDTGTWSLQQDGSLVLEGQPGVVVPHGNLLLREWMGKPGPGGTVGILSRPGGDGKLLAYVPSSPIEMPPVEPADVLTITIIDGWTGLSPLAPIEAYYRLRPTPGHFSGAAEFQVAGYTDLITRSTEISVPLTVIEELLALLESTPLEVGEYKPLFSHTDDFPAITIAVEGRAGDLEFASQSQGSRHIPWRVVVGPDQYVTYADTPAQALDLLDPYLAREVQEALFNLALERDQ
jgi:hypothetical protein